MGFNQTLKSHLQKLVNDHWDDLLDKILFAGLLIKIQQNAPLSFWCMAEKLVSHLT